MKEKIKSLVILILLGISIYLCFRIWQGPGNNPKTINNLGKPDTVYLPSQEYSKVNPYRDENLPAQVLIYRNNGHEHQIIPKGSDSMDSTDQINTLSPSSTTNPLISDPLIFDSISQIILKNNQLELTTKNTLDSTYKIRKFKIDPSKYNYNWVDNKLTYKKRINLQLVPYIKGSYRPFNKLTDLNAGISLETGKFNYNLGFNLFYYPNLSNKVGKDLEISITYKFK